MVEIAMRLNYPQKNFVAKFALRRNAEKKLIAKVALRF